MESERTRSAFLVKNIMYLIKKIFFVYEFSDFFTDINNRLSLSFVALIINITIRRKKYLTNFC